MLIDWFTVSAQIVNFLILLYLLKRFLYGPIMRTMRHREERIRERLKKAAEIQSEAERLAAQYRSKEMALEEKRVQRLKEIDEEAELHRRELLKQAKAEAEELRQVWDEAVRRDQGAFLAKLKKRTIGQVTSIARKALTDLADEELGHRLAAVFLRKLEALDEGQKKNCALAAQDNVLVVRSPFELDIVHKKEINEALRSLCDSQAQVDYETDLGMSLGIEMTVGDLRLSWGVDSYFDQLEKKVFWLLDKGTGEETAVEAGHEPEA